MNTISLPRPVVDVVFRLLDGWEPFLETGRVSACTWGDRDLSSVATTFEIVGSEIRFHFREASPGVVNEIIRMDSDAGNLLQGKTSDGMSFRVEHANVDGSKSSFPRGAAELRLFGYKWSLFDATRRPACWVARLDGMPKISRSNLHLSRRVTIGDNVQELESAGHLLLRGAYDYYLIRPHFDTDRCYIIVERERIDSDIIGDEFAALQFSVGCRLRLQRFYALDERGEIAAQEGGDHGLAQAVYHGSMPTVPLLAPVTWVAPLFRCICDAMRSGLHKSLHIPIAYYLDSLAGHSAESQFLHVFVGLEAAAHWSLRADNDITPAPVGSEAIKRAFLRHSISISPELLADLQATRNRVVHTGISTPQFRDAVGKLIVLAQATQRLIVALVCRISGYDGELAEWQESYLLDGTRLESPLVENWWRVGEECRREAAKIFEIRCDATVPTTGRRLQILVEGRGDVNIVRPILQALRIEDEVGVIAVGGKWSPAIYLRALKGEIARRFAILVDLDERSVAESVAAIAKAIPDAEVAFFAALPETAAWLFADEDAARRAAEANGTQALLNRLPLPEDISRPGELARQVFGEGSSWDFLRRIDVERAMARSPSLRRFVEGVFRLLGSPLADSGHSGFRTFSRDVLSTLLSEVSPSDSVAWRTLDGTVYTAEQLRKEIQAGTQIGQQYATDLLRIARDFLARKHSRKSPK